MHVKKKTTDLAAVKNALDMDDAKEVRLAWLGLAVGLSPFAIIALLLLIQYFI